MGVLMPTDGSEPPVVVGGHAASLWSLYFLSKGISELARYLPFTSKDLDLVGTMDLLERLQREMKGMLVMSPPRSPVLGRLEVLREDGGILRIEVWGFDFSAVWPTDELKRCNDGKIRRWLEHRQP